MKKKQYHRTKADICRDFGKNGIAKFHRTGMQKAWQDLNIIIDYLMVFSFNLGVDKLNQFHAYLDSWWYQYDNGVLTYDEIINQANELASANISFEPLQEHHVRQVAKGAYLYRVGIVNMTINNEIIRSHALHEACAVLALNDMGWKPKTLHKFDRCFIKLMDATYCGEKQKDIVIASYQVKLQSKYNFEYEKIIDPLEVTG